MNFRNSQSTTPPSRPLSSEERHPSPSPLSSYASPHDMLPRRPSSPKVEPKSQLAEFSSQVPADSDTPHECVRSKSYETCVNISSPSNPLHLFHQSQPSLNLTSSPPRSPTSLLTSFSNSLIHWKDKVAKDVVFENSGCNQSIEEKEKLDARPLLHIVQDSFGSSNSPLSDKVPKSIKQRPSPREAFPSSSFPSSSVQNNAETAPSIAAASSSTLLNRSYSNNANSNSYNINKWRESGVREFNCGKIDLDFAPTSLPSLYNDEDLCPTTAESLPKALSHLSSPLLIHPSQDLKSQYPTDILKIPSPHSSIGPPNAFALKEVVGYLGTGWLVAMAYVDPGNLEGDLLAGSIRSINNPTVGYQLLWVLFWATLSGFGLQRLAIKLGTVTGIDLATITRREYPRNVSVFLWVFTELCLIGADIQAVIGSAIGIKLIFGIPIYIGILITLIDTFIVLLIDYCGVRKLEACFAMLISLMAGCFFINMFTSRPNPIAIFKGITIVQIPQGALTFTVALVGSVVMPHNFFLQSAVVQSRPIERSNEVHLKRINRYYSIETFCLLFVSLLVNISVVVAFANPQVVLEEGKTLDLYTAHIALQSAIGKSSAWIWGLGLLAAGQCSTMACTYSGQFVMEGLLGLRITRLWLRVLVTRVTSIAPLVLLIYMNKSSVERVANWVNVMQAFNLPFILAILLKFASSKKVMGNFVLSRTNKVLSYTSGLILVVANMCLVINQLGLSTMVVILLSLYIIGLVYLWYNPISNSYATHINNTIFCPELSDLGNGR